MDTADILVILGSLAAIVWVNWYFFVAGRDAGAAGSESTGEGEKEGS